MNSGVLEKLFGSPARVRIIRLFLLNPNGLFSSSDIARRTKTSPASTRKEIALLKSIGLIGQKTEKISEIIKLKNGKFKNHNTRVQGLKLLQDFMFLAPLKNLLVNSAPVSNSDILKRLLKMGKIKLLVLSGIFIQDESSRIDMLVVGDSLKIKSINNAVKIIESELGKELEYAVLSTSEFNYRLGMYDRFIRDILDYPHEKIVNKLGIED